MKFKKNTKWIVIVLLSALVICAFIWNKELNSITGLKLGGSSAFADHQPKYVGEWDAGEDGYLVLSKNGDLKWYKEYGKKENNVASGTWEVMNKNKYGTTKKDSLDFIIDSLTIDGQKKEVGGEESLMTIESFHENKMVITTAGGDVKITARKIK
jgi:hypothetical protein